MSKLYSTIFRPKLCKRIAVAINFLVAFVCTTSLFAQTTQTFTSSGSFIVPAGVTSLTVECWGGGGGGGSTSHSGSGTSRGGGGAGGAYVKKVISSPVGSYSVNVGIGGASNTVGGDSWFGSTTTVIAKGGAKGNSGSKSNGTGGAGSITGSIGDMGFIFAGGDGANSGSSGSGGGGGGAGSGGTGNSASNNLGGAAKTNNGGIGADGITGTGSSDGNNGGNYGAGGSGSISISSGTAKNGGTGSSGLVTVTYSCPTYSLLSTSAAPQICIGNAVTVTLSSAATNLPAGTYTVTYNLSSPNAATGNTATMTVLTAGTGTFTTSALANSGTTTVTITNLSSGSGTGCSGAVNSNNTATVTIYPPPAATAGSSISTCTGTNAIVMTGAIATGTYSGNPTWTGGAGTWIQNADPALATFTPSGTSGSFTATLTLTSSNGCSNAIATRTITWNSAPSAPTSPVNGQRCGSGIVSLSASTAAGTTIDWYDSPSGGTLLLSGNTTYITPSISGTSTYYAESRNTTTNCVSVSRTPVTATINQLPQGTLSANGPLCGSGTGLLTFVASAGSAPFSITYNDGSGNIIANGASSGTPFNVGNNPVVTNTTYTLLSVTDNNGCSRSASFTGDATSITVYMPPAIISNPVSITRCATYAASFSVSATGDGLTYQWYRNGSAVVNSSNINGATSATLNIIQAQTSDAGTYTVVVSGNAPCGPAASAAATLTVNQQIAFTAQPAANTSLCEGPDFTVTAQVTGSVSSYQWTKNGLFYASGTNPTPGVYTLNIPAAIPSDGGTYQLVLDDGSGLGCPVANSNNAVLTVTQIPTVDNVADQVYCRSDVTTAINFTGSVAGTSYAWTNNKPNSSGIGLSAGGTGNIPGFTTANAGSTPIVATIQVTPKLNGCSGVPTNFTITVNPRPSLNAPAEQTVCNGDNTATVTFNSSSSVAGIVYNWTSTGNIIPTSGSGDILSFLGSNSGTTFIADTITVTPVAYGCSGPVRTFHITINPILSLTSTLTPSGICSGSVFSYSPAATGTGVSKTFNWSRAAVAGISNLAASGTGNPGETLINTTAAAIDVTYTYTVSATRNSVTCTNPVTFPVVVSVKPTPTVQVSPAASQTICSGNTITAVTLSNPNGLAGTALTWTRDNTASLTGTASSGTTTIPASALTNTTTANQTTVFTAKATLNGCSSTTTVPVLVYPPIINDISAAAVADIDVCSIAKQVSINAASAQGGDGTYTYQWQASFTGGSSWQDLAGQTGASLVYQYPQTNAFFRRVAYSGGCASVTSTEIHINKPSGSVVVSTTNGGNFNYCAGSTTGVSITVGPTVSGATYTLQYNTTGSTYVDIASLAGTGGTLTFNPVTTTGNYRVNAVIAGSGGCTQVINNITVGIDPLPAAPTVNAPVVCAGISTNLVGTLSGATINWYAASSGGSALNATPVTSGGNYAVTPSVTTIYYAEAVSSKGCVSTSRTAATVTVNQRPIMTSAASAAICSGGTVSIPLTNNISASATYIWVAASNGNINGESTGNQTTSTLNNVLTNTTTSGQTVSYTVTPTYPAGCTGTAQTVLVTVDPKPNVAAVTALAICSGNTFNVVPSGGTIPTSPATQYTWTSPTLPIGLTGGSAQSSPQSDISQTLTNTSASTLNAVYTVTPTAGACTGNTFTVTVPVTPRPVISDITSAICSGNSFSATPPVSGNTIPVGSTYTWAAPAGTNFSGGAASPSAQTSVSGTLTNTSVSGLPALVTYSVTPTNASCSGNAFNVVVTVNKNPTASITGTSAVCQSGTASVTLTGANGTAPYTFTYKDYNNVLQTASGSPSVSISGPSTAASGSFTYTLVSVQDNSSTSCNQLQPGTFTINVNPGPGIGTQPAISTCSGTSMSPAITGAVIPLGTTYTWSSPVMTSGLTGGSTGVDQSSFTTGIFTNSTTSAQTATFTITPKAGTGCPGSPFTLVVNVSPSIAGTAVWLGTSNSNWCDPNNWACGVVPTATMNALIPAGSSNNPVQIGSGCNATAMNITVENGARLSVINNGYLSIYGNFTNTSDPGMYSFGGTVDFTGGFGGIGGAQTIPAFAYNNVRISGGSVKTLAGPIKVNGTLILDNGVVVSTPANMLTVGATGNITNASNSSYIRGPLTRETNSTNTYYFPVGAGGEVRFATVQPQDVLNSSYTVYYQDAPTTGDPLGTDLMAVQRNEYWDVTKNSGAGAMPGFYYQNPNSQPAQAPGVSEWSSAYNPCGSCNVAVVEKDAMGNWYYTGGTAAGFAPGQSTYWQSNGYVNSRIAITVDGPYQYSFGYGYAIILPVTLVDFTGVLQGNNALLKWQLAAGSDLANMELEHSTDGKHFIRLAAKQANSTNSYDYLHVNLQPGTHFYRLVIKDKSGKLSYSKTVLLTVGKYITVVKGIRPTMVHAETFVDIQSAKQQSVRVGVYDMAGRMVSEYKGSLLEGANSYRIPAQALAQGIYTLQIKTDDGVVASLRIMKE